VRGLKTAWTMARQTFSEWSDDKGGRLGAALSYYTVFSLAPLLLIVISIAGLAFGRAAAEGNIFGQLSGLVGPDTARLIQAAVAKANHTRGGIVGTGVGLIALLAGATGVVTELQDALDTVWKVRPKPNRGVRGIVRTRLLSVAMILALGFLLLVSLVVSAALSAFGGWLRAVVGNIAILSWAIDAAVALAVFGKYLISLYIGRASVASAFGAAGSLAVLLVWIYYSAQIVLLGAEFTRVYANRFGAKVRPSEQAIPARTYSRASTARTSTPQAAAAPRVASGTRPPTALLQEAGGETIRPRDL